MADNVVIANPGAGGAVFAVDLVNGTSTPYVKVVLGDAGTDNDPISSNNPMPVTGSVGITGSVAVTGPIGVSGTASTQIVSSIPFFVSQSSAPWSMSQTGTSYITLSSSQIALGGGVQYLDQAATSAPTGTINMWAQGAAESTMVAVATSTPMPMFAISSNPHAISSIGSTSFVSISSSITLGITGTLSGTSFVSISSSRPLIVSQSSAPWDVSGAVVSTFVTGGTAQSSTFITGGNIQVDGSGFARGTGRIGVVGGVFTSTVPALVHSSAAALAIDSSARMIISPGSAEAIVSTTPLVRVGLWNAQDQQVTAFGGGVQYLEGETTTTPTGTAFLWKSLASTMTSVSSSRPLPINIVSTIALGFTPTGTSFVTISSSQVALGGGQQYLDGTVTTAGTGNLMIWAGGNSSDSMLAISTSNPLPVYQISTVPIGPLVGTTMVNVVSTVPNIVSGQVSTFANNVASTFMVGSISQSTTPMPASQGGLDTIGYVSVTTAPRTIKNSAGRLYDIWFTNLSTSTRFLKLFNASSASASTGTTLPLMTFGMPGGTSAVAGWIGSGYGYQFSTAISCAVTASSATSTDTSTPLTNDVLLQFGYR